MAAARVLCVDDDPRILEMLPRVLGINGYETITAASVPEALNTITSQQFDVLICDLNMGHAADGFTVVHTMRRVNPDCVNFILTGYPAFESALQALREQVDDYLTKPSDIPKLLDRIAERLKTRTAATISRPVQRLSAILRDNVDTIVSRSLLNMKANADVAAVPLADGERIDDLPQVLRELAEHLEAGLPNDGNDQLLSAARKRGETRYKQHFPLHLMVENERLIEQVINNVIYENLLAVNLSYLLLDLNKLNDALLLQLEVSILSYSQAEEKAA